MAQTSVVSSANSSFKPSATAPKSQLVMNRSSVQPSTKTAAAAKLPVKEIMEQSTKPSNNRISVQA
ncbi:MAG: hypothetical protein H7839_03000 [Magnetococcus sp. YQC-5]